MTIKIQSTGSISDIKEKFAEMFPFLKLEFFKYPHEESEPTAKKSMITSNPTIGEISKAGKEGIIETDESMTVHDLESAFRDKFGLFVQVFRNSGSVWLETSATDNMTLKEQNELGKEKSFPVEPADMSDIDYD